MPDHDLDDQQSDPIPADADSLSSEPVSSVTVNVESDSTSNIGINGSSDQHLSPDPEKVELTEEQVKELLSQLTDNTPGPAAPTETYTHPVTGREVYVPKQKDFGPAATIATISLLMFVGGGLATLMMVARAFDLHGDVLVLFVIGSCAVILGLAGGLLLKALGDKFWIGAIIGACFGVVGGILIYAQTSHHVWWH